MRGIHQVASALLVIGVAPSVLAQAAPPAAAPPTAAAPPAGDVVVTPPPAPGQEVAPVPIPTPEPTTAPAAQPGTSGATTGAAAAETTALEAPEAPQAEGDAPVAPPVVEGPAHEAGYFRGEGFSIKTIDGEDTFKLRIGLQSAYRFEPYWRDGDAQNRKTFFVLRPFMEGYVFRDWIRFWTSFEFAANPPYLLDSYIEFMPRPEIGFRIGQMWTPYSRHEYFGPQQILFPEWAIVADYFWSGRDKGITMLGVLGDDALIEYWAGVYSGTPLRQFTAIDGNYVVEGRVTVNPMGPTAANEALYITSEEPVPFRPSFTLQGYLGNVQSAVENFNPTSFRFDVTPSGETRKLATGGFDVWLQGEYFTFLVEGNLRRDNPERGETHNELGIWGQLGVMVVRRTVDVSVRGNFLNPSNHLSDDLFYSVEGNVGYYPFHNQNLVAKLRYGYGHQQTPAADDPDLEGVQLAAPTGDNQLLTLQLGLAF